MYRSISLIVGLLFLASVSLAQFNIRPMAIGSPQPTGSKTCAPIAPAALIANIGNQASPPFTVTFTIRDLFSNQIVYGPAFVELPGFNQNQQQTVQFAPAWTPPLPGTYQATVIVQAGDNIPQDDTNRVAFTVGSGELSRNTAITTLMFEYVPTSPYKDQLGVYLHNKTAADSLLPIGTIISDAAGTFVDTVKARSYFFVIDNEPGQYIEHSFTYVTMNGCSGAMKTQEARTPPVFNGVEINYNTYDNNYVTGGKCPPGVSIPATVTTPKPNNTEWAIIVPGPPIDAGDWDDKAIANDIERVKDYLNGASTGPGVNGANIAVAGNPAVGASLKDICDQIDALKGKACTKVYFYYIGHGYDGGMILRKDPGPGTDRVSYTKLACKLLEAGIQNVCIVIMACHSGSAVRLMTNKEWKGPDGRKRKLKGIILTSSNSANTTTGQADGSPFHKAMLECGKDPRANLDSTAGVSLYEACIWAKVNSPTMQKDGASCNKLNDPSGANPIQAPRVIRGTINDGRSEEPLKYEVIKFFYPPRTEGKKKIPVCRVFVYVYNDTDKPHRPQNKVKLICIEANGAQSVVNEAAHDLAPGERKCIAELPAKCKSFRFDVGPKRGIPLAGTTRTDEERAIVLSREELMAEDYALPGDSGSWFDTYVSAPPSYGAAVMPGRFYAYDSLTAFTVLALMPDTATTGGRMSATSIGNNEDTVHYPIIVYLFDSTHTANDLNRAFNYSYISHDSTLLFMNAGSHLSMTNSILSLDPQHIHDTVSDFFLEKFSFIESQIQTDSSQPYNLYLNRDLDWRNSSVIGANRIKVSGDNLNVHIENGMIINSKEYGIEIEGDRANDVIRGIHIDSATGTALRIRNAQNLSIKDFRIENTSGFDISSSLSSNTRLVDTYFDSSKVERPTDSLTRAWTTFFVVSDTAGDPLKDVIIMIADKNNVMVVRDTTDSLGFSRIHELVQYIMHDTKSTDLSTYTIHVRYNSKDSAFTYNANDRRAHEIRLKRAPTSVARERISEFAVSQHPNPASDNINIGFTLAKPSDVKITVYDALGKVMTTSQAFYPSGVSSMNVALGNMPTGWYVYEVSVNGVSERYRFVKE